MAAVDKDKELQEKTKFRLNWVYRNVKCLVGKRALIIQI